MNMPNLYHGSPYAVAVGDVLECGLMPKNFKQSSKAEVSLTSEPEVALHWAREAAKNIENCEQIYIYRVEPLSEVNVHRSRLKNYGKAVAYDEVRVNSARVVEVVFGVGSTTLITEDNSMKDKKTLSIYNSRGFIVRTQAKTPVNN